MYTTATYPSYQSTNASDWVQGTGIRGVDETSDPSSSEIDQCENEKGIQEEFRGVDDAEIGGESFP
jgi:hypothetical protein